MSLTRHLNRACYIFFGGLLQFVGGLLEFSLGHTFPSVVFCSFGAFYFSVGTGLIPSLNAWGAYAPEGMPATAGLKTTEYQAAVGMLSLDIAPHLPTFEVANRVDTGFFPLWMALLCFIYMILALRTNVCFVAVFFLLVLGLSLQAAAHWLLASDFVGNLEAARRLTTVRLTPSTHP